MTIPIVIKEVGVTNPPTSFAENIKCLPLSDLPSACQGHWLRFSFNLMAICPVLSWNQTSLIITRHHSHQKYIKSYANISHSDSQSSKGLKDLLTHCGVH